MQSLEEAYPKRISGYGKYNFIDQSGNLICSQWVDKAELFKNGLSLLKRKKGKWSSGIYLLGLFLSIFLIAYVFWRWNNLTPWAILLSAPLFACYLYGALKLYTYISGIQWNLLDENGCLVYKHWKRDTSNNDAEKEWETLGEYIEERKYLVGEIKITPTENNSKYQIIPRTEQEIFEYFSRAEENELSMHIYKENFTLTLISDGYLQQVLAHNKKAGIPMHEFSKANIGKYCLRSIYPSRNRTYLFDTREKAIGFLVKYAKGIEE